MKSKTVKARVRPEADEAMIRDYAQHLYEQSGCVPGHDLDNWLEAKRCLAASIPRKYASHAGHRRAEVPIASEVCESTVEAHNLAT